MHFSEYYTPLMDALYNWLFQKQTPSFWGLQPVMQSPVLTTGPIQNPFVPQHPDWLISKMSCVSTMPITGLTGYEKNAIIALLREHYHHDPRTGNSYKPTETDVFPYISDAQSRISIFKLPTNGTIVGVLASRPLLIRLPNSSSPVPYELTYYDFLCVDKSVRNKLIAPALIQRQLNHNASICGGLFKREGDLMGSLLPLVQYETPCFCINTILNLPEFIASANSIECVCNSTIDHIMTSIEFTAMGKFSVWATPQCDVLNILIRTQNIAIVCVRSLHSKKIHAVFWFRDAQVFLHTNGKVLYCFGSCIDLAVNTEAEYMQYFGTALTFAKGIFSKGGCSVYIAVEGISDNVHIIKYLNYKNIEAITTSSMAYYMHNYSCAGAPITPSKTLIVT